jgi:hypothetical protein
MGETAQELDIRVVLYRNMSPIDIQPFTSHSTKKKKKRRAGNYNHVFTAAAALNNISSQKHFF